MLNTPETVEKHYTVQERIAVLQKEFDIIDIISCDEISTVDLYVKIKNLHRESYENGQRIIFVITKDYGLPDVPGQILQNLQSIINDVDISNFFICLLTTNANIDRDYEYVLSNISQDQVPFNLYLCHGEYIKDYRDDVDIFSKYVSVKDSIKQINDLRPDQKKLLFESKTFCMLAWNGINVEADNQVRPCCEFEESLGDPSKQSLQQIWNSDSWKQIRKNMLEGIPVKACRLCYEKEKNGS